MTQTISAGNSPAGRAVDAPAVAAPSARDFVDAAGLTVTFLEGRPGLRLRGEADMLNAGALRQAIAALPAGLREVHLELAELAFIDVAGTRELVALARRPTRPCLILYQPPRSLTRILRLLWPDCRQLPAPAISTTRNNPAVTIQAA